MSITAIVYQPATGQLMAAYRPVILRVNAVTPAGNKTVPYVCCDIYVEGIYFKTILRTVPIAILATSSQYEFDIQDALQEVLQPNLASAINQKPLVAPNMSAQIFCKFRSTGGDANSLIVEEGPIPVQATNGVPSVAGGGSQSQTFWAINAALQHTDNQNLSGHLNTYKTGTWDINAYPLTHRSRYYFCPGDADHYPLAFIGPCTSVEILLHVKRKGQNTFDDPLVSIDPSPCNAVDYLVGVDKNKITVTVPAAAVAPASFIAQYRKVGDPSWITVGQGLGPAFTWTIPPVAGTAAGNYEARVITFCNSCLAAAPIVHTFAVVASNTAWRGINPSCVNTVIPVPFYIKLVQKNSVATVNWFPNDTVRASRVDRTKVDLFAQFYSDAAFLHPYVPNIANLQVYVVQQSRISYQQNGTATTGKTITESLIGATVNANAAEVLLSNQKTVENTYNYNPYPTVNYSSTEADTYRLFPDATPRGYNTGQAVYNALQQYYSDTNVATGVSKPNTVGDPDYIPPYNAPALCPSGPGITTADYSGAMRIDKLLIKWSGMGVTAGQNIYPTQNDNLIQQAHYIASTPGGTYTIQINATTLAGAGNTTGHVFATVQFVDNTGATKTSKFQIQNGVDTTLPATFPNVKSVNISNY